MNENGTEMMTVEKRISEAAGDTVNKEIMEESSQMTKLHNISGANAELKNYLKDLTWENSRTVFEVRTTMLFNCRTVRCSLAAA